MIKTFMAAALMKKIKPSLMGAIEIPKYNKILNVTVDKKKIVAREMNENAYNELVLAMEDEVAFEVVEESTTENLPDWNAQIKWTK